MKTPRISWPLLLAAMLVNVAWSALGGPETNWREKGCRPGDPALS